MAQVSSQHEEERSAMMKNLAEAQREAEERMEEQRKAYEERVKVR